MAGHDLRDADAGRTRMAGQVLPCRWEDEVTLGWEDEDSRPRPAVTLGG